MGLREGGALLVQTARFLSPTAMIPIIIIWFGIGEMAKYALVFWGTVSLVLINTIAGVIRTPKIRQNAALCLGASEADIFRLIVLPSAIPFIVVGMRLALASAFVADPRVKEHYRTRAVTALLESARNTQQPPCF